MNAFLIVSGDFTPGGGQDRANYELAWHLAERVGASVELAAHYVAEPLSGHRNVHWRKARRPMNRHLLGEPFLASCGRDAARNLQCSQVLVNGGNCAWTGVNWVHALHAAWKEDDSQASLPFRMRARIAAFIHRRAERKALRMASLVLANSNRTRQDVLAAIGIDPSRVRTVYYGVDPAAFRPPTTAERESARRGLSLPQDRPVVAFIGGLGADRRKGFDILFSAWETLCKDTAWDALLVAAGTGGELELWKRRSAKSGLGGRIRLLGFTRQVPDLLAACDALASPNRYEPYGLSVHEALCCGVPALVTRSSGVAERYPADLDVLLLDDPPEAGDLARRLRLWRSDRPGFAARVAPFGAILRERTWADMSAEIVGLMSNLHE